MQLIVEQIRAGGDRNFGYPIALERATNPFLRCPDVAAFIALKRDWPTVKQRLGLK
jgi:hypothetical protein